MGLLNEMRNSMGVVTVQIEGFFTERFLNLCRINNIKIWDIKTVVKGVVRFKINVYDFKKLRMVARKTKCKVLVKNKKGIYFTLFKYRKRKIIFLLFFLALFFSIFSSTFIWKIDIEGNESISEYELMNVLKKSGVFIGSSKIGLNKKEVVNEVRVNVPDITWAGFDIDGTKVTLTVVEKTKLDEKDKQNTDIGNIIAKKSGVITKIVPENGTAVFKTGSYIDAGTVAIEGIIYNKYIENVKVPAKGTVYVNCNYSFENQYKYEEVLKEKTGKIRYTIGITINSNENMLNYLNKERKYDITKSSKQFNIFGVYVSFDLYKCEEYTEKINIRTKEELENVANIDSDTYLQNEILAPANDASLVNKNYLIEEIDDGILVKTDFVVNEEVGEFVAGEVFERTNENKENE